MKRTLLAPALLLLLLPSLPIGLIIASAQTWPGIWPAPMDLTAEGDQFDPKAAVGTNGTLYIAWWGSGQAQGIFYLERAPDGAWRPKEALAQGGGQYAPDLALGPDGSVHIAWFGDAGGGATQIRYAWRPPGGPWRGPEQITKGPYSQRYPRLAIGPDGSIHAVWIGTSTSSPLKEQVFYSKWRPGGGIGEPLPLTAEEFEQGRADVAVAPDGSVHVVWSGRSASSPVDEQIRYRRMAPDGKWSEVLELTSGAGSKRDPQVLADSEGRIHVVWSGGGIWYASGRGGTFGAVEQVTDEPGASLPTLAVSGSGRVHVAWMAPGSLKGRARDPRGGWGPLEAISQGEGPQWSPCLAISPWGTLHLVWHGASRASKEYRIRYSFSAIGDFELRAEPSSLRIEAGSGGEIKVTVVALRGFPAPIHLKIQGGPAGLSIKHEAILKPNATSSIAIFAPEATKQWAGNLSITGFSEGLSRTASVRLEIGPKGGWQLPIAIPPFPWSWVVLAILFGVAIFAYMRARGRKRRTRLYYRRI
ncbi:MAG: sialidase family protein, partial [Candidatus Bathyarchaeia archaeon]